MTRVCGDCSLCCKVFDINRPDEGLVKPGNTWCKDCLPGTGCGIYETRPPVCAEFKCAWLSLDWLPLSLKPNESGAIFQDTGTPVGITCTIDRPEALRRADVQQVLKALADVQKFVIIVFRNTIYYVYVIHPDYGRNIIRLRYADYTALKRRGKLKGLPYFKDETNAPKIS